MLEINNSQGQQLIGEDTRVFTILGVENVTNLSNGSKSVPFSAYAGTPEVFVLDTGALDRYPPQVTIVGDSVVWNYNNSGNSFNMPVKIIYGVW